MRCGNPLTAEAQAADIAELQTVMRLIDDHLRGFEQPLPGRYRRLIGNALLNLAVNRLLTVEGSGRASTILYRLADLVANRRPPTEDEAFPLTGQDA